MTPRSRRHKHWGGGSRVSGGTGEVATSENMSPSIHATIIISGSVSVPARTMRLIRASLLCILHLNSQITIDNNPKWSKKGTIDNRKQSTTIDYIRNNLSTINTVNNNNRRQWTTMDNNGQQWITIDNNRQSRVQNP
eukprot:1323283-Amorphochlora_amoeboformis.AAC.1